MFGIHWGYIAILLVVVLIIFGPGRLPELGGAVGKAMREFRKATSELTNEVTSTVQSKPEAPAPAPIVHSESAAKASTSEADPPKS
jgi:sec-independent protein translocase protein TatA